MTNVAIYDKYANAITEVLSSPTYLPLGTALLMLRLAIGGSLAALYESAKTWGVE